MDEVGHFPAGLAIWEQRRFDLYCVNPPLVRAVATLPVHLAADLEVSWPPPDVHPGRRPEFPLGRELIAANAPDIFWWFTVGRWMCIPFSLLAGLVIYRWAHDLFGALAGLLALVLWCFDPMVLGNAQLMTPDTGAAAFAVLAAYLFWKWLKQPSWSRAFLGGVVLGLAELCKTSLIILFPLWIVLWIACRFAGLRQLPCGGRATEGGQLALILSLGIYIVNLGYMFDGSLTRLGDFEFVSATLKGETRSESGNRFKDSWLSGLRVPLPKHYVMGIDIQKRDFESQYQSYLAGEWRRDGWWFRYLYGLAVKMPAGTLLLLAASALAPMFRRGLSAPWRDELILIAPALSLLVLVSSQAGLNHHVRYTLPAFPFLFIACGRLARCFVYGNGPEKAGAELC
jgi:4-amino-4-deoxy-L-arabinose transferase-like glycosyltransferase